MANRVLNNPADKPAIGFLLAKRRSETNVRYSLEGYVNSMEGAGWEQQVGHALQADIAAELPSFKVVYPLAHERVAMHLDDRVKVNYNKFPGLSSRSPG